MLEHISHEELFAIINEVERDPRVTQRAISEHLGISLGKTNYLLKALTHKGFIRLCGFARHPKKMVKAHYALTKKGLEEKMRLMSHFLKVKESEYNSLKKEWEILAEKRAKSSAVPIRQ